MWCTCMQLTSVQGISPVVLVHVIRIASWVKDYKSAMSHCRSFFVGVALPESNPVHLAGTRSG